MSRSSGRAQVEPTAALAAVLALTAALGVYGVAYAQVPLDAASPAHADAALAHVDGHLGPGPADPDALAAAVRGVPGPSSVNATLRTATRTWAVGPPRPAARVDTAATALPVRVSNATVRPGRLSVAVWR
ncbi:hypothetical protein EFA46_005940 [Halarchaeum sp. CBA1220]|uniref:DUF7285 family protein n=1 Tax=Halarchaeum sp. CBA1220 TaxID=1853682 RepID=UPI000F3A9254|nr:hypothetical protein [Halarchaeum sp. CBA1220]QLC32653.1 hypothetical protein EFA46_005940 [Halarchaeum sp. CBA1220]